MAEHICNICIHEQACAAEYSVDKCPHFTNSYDVAPVRHARWEAHPQAPDVGNVYVCSLCKMNVDGFVKRWYNYCHNCGARMDLEVCDD